MFDSSLNATQFGNTLKRTIRERYGVTVKAKVGNSRTAGKIRPPREQYVTVHGDIPSQLYKEALNLMYPGATRDTGNISTRSIALHGVTWESLLKHLATIPV